MSDTYSQLHIHCVFAVKFRAALIDSVWEEELHKYITGIVQGNKHKMLAVNSAFDHSHMFIGLNPAQSISDMMQMVKADSSKFIERKGFTKAKFQWQSGYGAFSHSRSDIDSVVKYILAQKEHHQSKTFREEYAELLKRHGMDDRKYIFDELLD
jgi:putative transposase